jgi:hypothetical protein
LFRQLKYDIKIDMVRHPEFTDAEWNSAPEYRGPGVKELHKHSGTVILDFESLQMTANMLEQTGAFRSNNGLDTLKAPIKLGGVPAAFLKIVSLNEDDYLVHTPHGQEILVVLNGILTIKNSRFASRSNMGADRTEHLRSGDVVALAPEGIQLTAHGLDRQAASLALSIMGMHPEQTELIILQNIFNTEKKIDPDGRTKLPYED